MPALDLPTLNRKRSPAQIQRAVLVALVIREMRSRVQGHWMGLVWMLFEPLAHVMVLLALFGFRHHVVSLNIEYPVFLVTGMLPFFVFRNLARRLPNAIGANRGLYGYRQVKPMDAVIARSAVEVGLNGAVYVSALALLGWLGYHWLPIRPLELLAVFVVLVLLGLGFGLVLAVAAHNRPKVESMIGMLFMPLYLLSGVIFPVQSLPANVRDWLLWNPVLHLIDLSREYFIPAVQPLPGVTFTYPASFMLVTLALGMALYRLNRHKLIATS